MITFALATAEDVRHVAQHARPRDIEEILAVGYAETAEELVEDLVARCGGFAGAYCFKLGGVPVCILIWVAVRPGVWDMGLFATKDLKKIGKYVTDICGRMVFKGLRAAGCHRVECKSISGYDSVHKWLKFLGFRLEAVHKKFGRKGEDFCTFVWIEGMPWPRGYEPTAEDLGSRPEKNL